jgi:SAM-dependent methyltransferase
MIAVTMPPVKTGDVKTGNAKTVDVKTIDVKTDKDARPSVIRAAFRYWSDLVERKGRLAATGALVRALWEFARDSTPDRLRRRYGDSDYDWDHRVNTTSAALGWRDRLLGVFHSPYQPTEPALFHEMLNTLAQHANLNFPDFTFLDLGSGKGRTLLMAADYPFRRIVGVELLPALHKIAQENFRAYKGESQQCFALESICADATEFPLPDEPLVIYLFNPFREAGLWRVIAQLEKSLHANPRPLYVLYHNPLLEHVLRETGALKKIGGTHQYSIYSHC